MSDTKLLRGVSILCWVIGGGAIAGAVALAIQGNVGGTIGLVVFGAGWTGFGFLARYIGRTAGWASAIEETQGATTAAVDPPEEAPEDESSAGGR